MRKDALYGPLAFTLIGAATGVCAGMLSPQRDWDRIPLEDSVPVTATGGLLGCLGQSLFKLGFLALYLIKLGVQSRAFNTSTPEESDH